MDYQSEISTNLRAARKLARRAAFELRTHDARKAREILDAALNRTANQIAARCGVTRDCVIGTLAAARAYYGADYVLAVRSADGVMRYTYARP